MFLTIPVVLLLLLGQGNNKYAVAENCGGEEGPVILNKVPFVFASTREYNNGQCYAFTTNDPKLYNTCSNCTGLFMVGLISSGPYPNSNLAIYRARCLKTNTEDFQVGGVLPDGGDAYSVTLMGYCSNVLLGWESRKIFKYFDSVTGNNIAVLDLYQSRFTDNRYVELGTMCYSLPYSATTNVTRTVAPDESPPAEYNKIHCQSAPTTTVSTVSTTTSTLPQKQPRVAIYRFLNGNDHFYTNSEAEYKAVLNNPTARFESVIGYMVLSLESPATIPIYRLYAHSIGHHMYAGVAEKNVLVASGNWNDEGLLGYCSDKQQVGMSVLHRFYNTINYDHLFTTDENEMAHVKKYPEWNYEGVVCSIYRDAQPYE